MGWTGNKGVVWEWEECAAIGEGIGGIQAIMTIINIYLNLNTM